MGLGVEFTSDPDINISRKQLRAHNGLFYQEHDEFISEVSAFKSMVSLTSHTVYTVPTGKKFHLRSLVVSGGTKRNAMTFYSSSVTTTTKQFKLWVGSQGKTMGMVTKTGLKGYCFTTKVIVVLGTSTSTGTGLAVGGILEAQPDV